MEENIEDKASSSLFSRYRSPSFRKAEINLLVQLVEKYKNVLTNKATNANANQAKDKAWDKVAKEFNGHGLGFERGVDVLRTKWDNMKRSARKLAKDVPMDTDTDFNDDISKTVAMLCNESGQNLYDDKIEDLEHEKDIKPWLCEEDDDDSINSTNDIETQCRTSNKYKRETLSGYSPNDCKLLLQCVREEKNVLFSKTSLLTKHRAWRRIAESYNKESPRKRTPKELSKKFNCMKNMAKKVNIKGYFKDIKGKKYETLNENIEQKVKSEPIVDCAVDLGFDSDDDKALSSPVNLNLANTGRLSFNHDPLSSVQGSDSGLVSISDNNTVKRDSSQLKSDLLQYKMVTARLERKRIEDKIKQDEREREMKELEHSLRLRTARLELLAAEAKFRSTHPTLKYTVEEQRAQEYLCNSQLDIG